MLTLYVGSLSTEITGKPENLQVKYDANITFTWDRVQHATKYNVNSFDNFTQILSCSLLLSFFFHC